MTVIRNNTELFYFSDTHFMASYDIVTDRWPQEATPTCMSPLVPGTTMTPKDSVKSAMKALTNPTTDLVYIPFGFGNGTEMLVFMDYYNHCSGVPMPPSSRGYSYAWSDFMGALYMFGDTVPPTGPTMWQFQANANTWIDIPMKGSPPAVLYDGCLTLVTLTSLVDLDNRGYHRLLQGRKLLLFGGENLETEKAFGDMFIFDITTLTWTKATSATRPRTEMACASAGDYFVAWGGVEDPNISQPSAEMLLYNFKSDKWLTQEEITTSSNNTASSSASPAGSGSNDSGLSRAEAAAFGGGTAAAVIAIAAIVGLLVYRHHQRKNARSIRHPQNLKVDSLVFSKKSDSTLLFSNGHDPIVIHDPHASPHLAAAPQYWNENIKTEVSGDGQSGVFVPILGHQSPQYQPLSTWKGVTPLSQPAMPSPFPSPQDYSIVQLDPSWPQEQLNATSLNAAVRSPQGEHNEVPVGALEQIALIKATYEQNMEQMRRDQRAALERVRQQWEEDQAQRAKK
ncbi:hypothetical protein BGZ95_002767 [Linnemannia exigua]|uniref:Kelch repeat protein n=1 Tax=Linnemannia exigua TaxID=604196 RepID=A0AAD4DLT2_9FUNG|nr:hypothetical protein BGZ95_002767 [Linnemannia exigua]